MHRGLAASRHARRHCCGAARLRPPDRHIVSLIIMTDTLSQWEAEYVVWQTGDPSNFDCY